MKSQPNYLGALARTYIQRKYIHTVKTTFIRSKHPDSTVKMILRPFAYLAPDDTI